MPCSLSGPRACADTFMLDGLKEVESELRGLRLPFTVLAGAASDVLPAYISRHKIGAVVTDFSPLRRPREWREKVAKEANPAAVYEVDAHNVVPAWLASDKQARPPPSFPAPSCTNEPQYRTRAQEVGARTLRPKIESRLPTWLIEIPRLSKDENSPTAASIVEEASKGAD